jgi:hypothetical protein
MRQGTNYRGQPLLVLVGLLGAWVIMRTLLWQSPFTGPQVSFEAPQLAQVPEDVAPVPEDSAGAGVPSAVGASATLRDQGVWQPALPTLVPVIRPPVEPVPFQPSPSLPQARNMAPRMAGGHNLMLMAGFSRMELPPQIAALFNPPAPIAPAAEPFQPAMAQREAYTEDRWSADAWILLREDTTTAVTSGRGSYGQSQVGMVVRYRLAPSSGHRPTLYYRASRALAGAQESEAALGVAARPLPGLPVTVAAEVRLTRSGGRTLTRPAAYAVTEFSPVEMPGGFTGEAYLQAGYVGGEFSTAFVDGQLRAEREVFDLGELGEVTAGGGAWGGAQKGATRLDIGPSASLRLDLGGTPQGIPARVSMDWRFRVAGEAEPRSGPALTISAGF